MTMQALAALLVSWVVPSEAPREDLDVLPRWERHPVERKLLREEERRAAHLQSQFSRPW